MNRMQAWSGMFALSSRKGLVSPDYSVFDAIGPSEGKYFEHLFGSTSAVRSANTAARSNRRQGLPGRPPLTRGRRRRRVGVIVDAKEFPEARTRAYRLWVDLGSLGIKRSSAQITERYRLEDLIGPQVVCVVNFPPKQVGPVTSEVLVMGAYTRLREVALLRPDEPVPPGPRIG